MLFSLRIRTFASFQGSEQISDWVATRLAAAHSTPELKTPLQNFPCLPKTQTALFLDMIQLNTTHCLTRQNYFLLTSLRSHTELHTRHTAPLSFRIRLLPCEQALRHGVG